MTGRATRKSRRDAYDDYHGYGAGYYGPPPVYYGPPAAFIDTILTRM